MANNSLINAMSRFPEFINRDESSKLYGIVKAFIDESDITQVSYIDRARSMIGISRCTGIDIDRRWGAFLNIPRLVGETDAQYRGRIKTIIFTRAGGTARSLRYAVSTILGISDRPDEVDDRIIVYDSWEYAGDRLEEGAYTTYGNTIVYIDFLGMEFTDPADILMQIELALIGSKAGGVNLYMILDNISPTFGTYISLDRVSYDVVSSFTYEGIE